MVSDIQTFYFCSSSTGHPVYTHLYSFEKTYYFFQALHQHTTPQVEGTIQTTQIISAHIPDYGMIIFGKGVSMIFIIRVYRITELKKMTKGDFEIPALFCLPQLGKQSLNFVTHKFPHHSKGGNLKIPFTYISFFTLFLCIPYTA